MIPNPIAGAPAIARVADDTLVNLPFIFQCYFAIILYDSCRVPLQFFVFILKCHREEK